MPKRHLLGWHNLAPLMLPSSLCHVATHTRLLRRSLSRCTSHHSERHLSSPFYLFLSSGPGSQHSARPPSAGLRCPSALWLLLDSLSGLDLSPTLRPLSPTAPCRSPFGSKVGPSNVTCPKTWVSKPAHHLFLKNIYWNMTKYIFVCIGSSCLCATAAELRSCGRDHVACKS